MNKILVVEDEEAIRLGIVDTLEMEGYSIEEAEDGEKALDIAQNWKPDLVVLDVMLPKKSGFDVCRSLRKSQPDIFILMLTAKSDEIDKLSGFNMGADDYMTKPFSFMELNARIKSMLRRLNKKPDKPSDSLTIGDIEINFKKYTASRHGDPLDISSKEIQILKYFNDHRGEVVTREDLLQNIWGYSIENMPTTRTVDNQIARLRQKIEEDHSQPKYLLSVRGVGYKFDPELEG